MGPLEDELFAPIGTAYLQAALGAAGFEATVETVRFDPSRPEPPVSLLADPPLLVGISATGNELDLLGAFVDVVRASTTSVPIVVGGYCSLAGEDVFEDRDIDVLCVGEGESTVVELAVAFARREPIDGVAGIIHRTDAGLVQTSPRSQPDDLDSLPSPTYTHIGATGAIRVYASRGCPYDCTYCEIKDFYGRSKRVRRHGREYVEGLIDRLVAVRDEPVDLVYFNDDEFLLHSEHLREMGQAVRSRGLQMIFQTRTRDVVRHIDEIAANRDVIAEIHLGVESFSDRQLTRWHKGTDAATNRDALRLLADLDVACYPYMILTDSHTTTAELHETCAGLLAAPAGPVYGSNDHGPPARLRPVQRNVHLNRMKRFDGTLERAEESAWLDDLWLFLERTAPAAQRLARWLNASARELTAGADAHPIAEMLERRVALIPEIAVLLTERDQPARAQIVTEAAAGFNAEATLSIGAAALVSGGAP